MVAAAYCSKELCQMLDKAGINAHHVMAFEKGGSWYRKYTLDIACKWLREEHLLHIEPHIKAFFHERPKKKLYHRWCPTVIVLPSETNDWGITRPKGATGDEFFYEGYKAFHDTYEDAVEEAIKYCIEKLIKKN